MLVDILKSALDVILFVVLLTVFVYSVWRSTGGGR